jgi:hypothetical protein
MTRPSLSLSRSYLSSRYFLKRSKIDISEKFDDFVESLIRVPAARETTDATGNADTADETRFLRPFNPRDPRLSVWSLNELDGARAKRPPNANDSCGLGRGSGDAIRFGRNG